MMILFFEQSTSSKVIILFPDNKVIQLAGSIVKVILREVHKLINRKEIYFQKCTDCWKKMNKACQINLSMGL